MKNRTEKNKDEEPKRMQKKEKGIVLPPSLSINRYNVEYNAPWRLKRAHIDDSGFD